MKVGLKIGLAVVLALGFFLFSTTVVYLWGNNVLEMTQENARELALTIGTILSIVCLCFAPAAFID